MAASLDATDDAAAKARDLSPRIVGFTTGADERDLDTGETIGAEPIGLLDILAA